jgi:hypothetical protein
MFGFPVELGTANFGILPSSYVDEIMVTSTFTDVTYEIGLWSNTSITGMQPGPILIMMVG